MRAERSGKCLAKRINHNNFLHLGSFVRIRNLLAVVLAYKFIHLPKTICIPCYQGVKPMILLKDIHTGYG